jgi:hypothetical protein
MANLEWRMFLMLNDRFNFDIAGCPFVRGTPLWSCLLSCTEPLAVKSVRFRDRLARKFEDVLFRSFEARKS